MLDVWGEQSAVVPYLRAIRAHWPIVIAVTLAALVGAGAWLMLRSPTYEARALVLVTPLPPDALLEFTEELVRDSGDPTRTVQTAATLIDSRQVAGLVALALGPGWSTDRVQSAVEVRPEGESNVLAVGARADSAVRAAEVANTFTNAALSARRAVFKGELAEAIRRVRAEQAAFANTPAGAPAALAEKLAELQSVEADEDPTLALLEEATPPQAPVGAPPWLILALALVAGLTLGVVAAALVEVLRRGARLGQGPAEGDQASGQPGVARSATS